MAKNCDICDKKESTYRPLDTNNICQSCNKSASQQIDKEHSPVTPKSNDDAAVVPPVDGNTAVAPGDYSNSSFDQD